MHFLSCLDGDFRQELDDMMLPELGWIELVTDGSEDR